MVRLTDRPAMTIAVDLGSKATKQTNKQTKYNRNFIIVRILCINQILCISLDIQNGSAY